MVPAATVSMKCGGDPHAARLLAKWIGVPGGHDENEWSVQHLRIGPPCRSQFVCSSALRRYPCCVSVCLHCTVSSACTSVHNCATHMCHLSYNCHLHSQWARLRHTKVACHIHVSFVPALTETRRSGVLFICFTLATECQVELTAERMSKCHNSLAASTKNLLSGKLMVEFKAEDCDRLGPKLCRRGLHGQRKSL